MIRHIIYDVHGQRQTVDLPDEPFLVPTPEEIDAMAVAAADKRVASVMELAEAMGVTLDPAEARANLIAIERRK